jgi:basic amino acid/polyamine antiporter, APA family
MPDLKIPLTATNKTAIPLSRVLGLTSGILLVAGIMIGSGIFKKIAPMSASGLNGNYIIAAWVLAGIVTIFGAFTGAGLATMTTESGGAYEYLRLVFGNFVSFLFGWSSFTIIGSASIAAIAVVFASSVNSLIPLYDPLHHLKDISIGHLVYPFSDSGIKIFAIITIILLTWVNVLGTKKGAILNNLVTYAKVAGIMILIIIGLFYTGSKADIAITGKAIAGTGGISAFFAAMLSAFWAYDGWLNVAFISGEIKNPKKNVPLAIIAGISLVMLLYVLVNIAYIKVLSLHYLASLGENDIAATVMAGTFMGSSGTIMIAILIMLSTFGSLNGLIITYARLYYQMSKEGFFFTKAANVHPRFRTPYMALIYSMIISCALVFSGSFDLLTDMIVFAGFLFYALLAWGLILMKRKGRITVRLIGYPFVPIVFILFSIALLVNTVITQTWQTFSGILLMLGGVPFYYFFKRKGEKSREKGLE